MIHTSAQACLRQAKRALLLGSFCVSPALASEAEVWSSLDTGTVVLFRHALAPGIGDPPGHTLDDCRSQRNLSEAGREQARRIGAEFRQKQIQVGAVWSSQWCRTRDTADLAFPGQRVDQTAFNSFFNTPAVAARATREAQQALSTWRGPGVLVVVTHQVNITALTDIVPDSGEGVVLKPSASGELKVLGRIKP